MSDSGTFLVDKFKADTASQENQNLEDTLLEDDILNDFAAPAVQRTPRVSLRFPLDLGHLLDQNYPFVQFQIIKFRDRWALMEDNDKSAKLADIASQKDILGTINLPLPQDFQNSVAPQWEIADSQVIAAGEDLYKKLMSGNVLGAIQNSGPNLRAILFGGISKKIQFQTANPKKQAFFGGIEPRTFAFNYTFSPQSEAEAIIIESIIREFTKHSLPELNGPGDAYFNFPSEYLITFHGTKGFPILDKGTNSCVCTSVSTNYTSSGVMQLLRSGHVVQIGLALTFTETTVRTKTDPGV